MGHLVARTVIRPAEIDTGRESRQGRPTIAHRFIGGNPSGKKGQVPSGTKEIVEIPGRLLSSLTGLVPSGDVTPALKRWAIVGRPAGLKNESDMNRGCSSYRWRGRKPRQSDTPRAVQRHFSTTISCYLYAIGHLRPFSNRPENVLKIDSSDDAVDACQYLIATNTRAVAQGKFAGV